MSNSLYRQISKPAKMRGSTPLHEAAKNGNESVISKLLEAKSHVDNRDEVGDTALHYAALNGRDGAVGVLLAAKADPTAKNKLGEIPLHYGAQSGHEATVRKLLSAAPSSVMTKSKTGETPLHFGAVGGGDAIYVLLSHSADVNAKNKIGSTPLHYGTSAIGKVKAVDVLLQHKADVNAQDEANMFTPLHNAAFFGQEGCVKLLLAAKADVCIVNKAGKTPAEIAFGKPDIVELFSMNHDTQLRFARDRITQLEKAVREQVETHQSELRCVQDQIDKLQSELGSTLAKNRSIDSIQAELTVAWKQVAHLESCALDHQKELKAAREALTSEIEKHSKAITSSSTTSSSSTGATTASAAEFSSCEDSGGGPVVTIIPFHILHEIAREGGSGVKIDANTHHGYLNYGPFKNAHITVKKLSRQSSTSDSDVLHDFDVMTKMFYPGLVPLWCIAWDDHWHYFVHPYMSGQTLNHRLNEKGGGSKPFDWKTRLRAATSLANAVSFIHSDDSRTFRKGFSHEMIKATNIYFDELDNARLGGVGMHRWCKSSDNTNVQNGYLDPQFEQESSGGYQTKHDCYALGVVILQLLTGQKASEDAHTKPLAIRLSEFLSVDPVNMHNFPLDFFGHWPKDVALQVCNVVAHLMGFLGRISATTAAGDLDGICKKFGVDQYVHEDGNTPCCSCFCLRRKIKFPGCSHVIACVDCMGMMAYRGDACPVCRKPVRP